MAARYLITADPVERLDPRFDLGVAVSVELLRRGVRVDYLDITATPPERADHAWLERLPVRRVVAADRRCDPFWELGPVEHVQAVAYDVILHRKDPPVDDAYRAWHRPFGSLPRRIVQVNRPPAIYELSEHTLHLRFPRWAAPTEVCRDLQAFVAAVRRQRPQAVAKPLNTYCGIGVEFLDPGASEEGLAAYWERWGPEVVVQPYLEAVEREGDLRILAVDGRVLGAVLRVPPEGSRIANLHAGGRAAPGRPTARELEAARRIGEALAREGLHLLGLDFIGGYLTEINFTSPTLVVQIEEVTGRPAVAALVDELERLRSRASGGGRRA